MDAAYDAKRIEDTSRKSGHVPITDKNGRGQEIIPMAPFRAERYKIRSSAKWANSRLKEDFGANNVIVRGHCKVTMWGHRAVCRSAPVPEHRFQGSISIQP